MRDELRSVARDQAKTMIFMQVAVLLSRLGTCPRKAVGAVLIRDGRCISWGYNGAPPGLPHCEDNNHGWILQSAIVGEDMDPDDIHAMEDEALETYGCRNATHAEANALSFAARQGISTDDSILFVTVAPCDVCSKLLIAAGVRRVYFQEEYRDPAGLELLKLAGIGAVMLP